jgi:branched-chain amino acid transport system ATP-binding protein
VPGHLEPAAQIVPSPSPRGRFGLLLIEHDMQAVFALADRISVLVQGRIIVTGRPAEIRDHPEVRMAYLGEDLPA